MKQRMTASGMALVALLCISAVAFAQSAMDNSLPVPVRQSASMQKTGPSSVLAQWSTLAPIPAAKQYHGSVYLDGAIYVFGGINPTGQGYDLNCYKYDIAAANWSTIAPLPTPRALASVEAVNGKIYICGGYSSTNPWTTEKAVLIYDPVANSYTTGATSPFGVFSAGSFVYENRIWIVGGGTTAFSTGSNSVQIYDPAQDKWKFSLSIAPLQARAFGMAVVNGTVYMVGGATYPGGTLTPNASFYSGVVNADEITFTKLTNYPNGTLHRHSVGGNGTKVYVTSGIDATGVSVATMEYDPIGNSWTGKEQKPSGVFYGGPFVSDAAGKMYAIGGTSAAGAAVSTFEVFNPNVTAAAKLDLSKNSIDDWAKRGVTAQIPLVIKNPGGAPLTYTFSVAGAASAWLSVSKMTGTVQVGKPEVLNVLINGAAMTNGDNAGVLNIASNDPDKKSVDIPVTIHVQDQDVDEPQNVLIEEGTGTWCGYCPYGADSLKAAIARFPGRVFGISYHGGSATEPLMTPSTAVWAGKIGLTGYPQGSVNRLLFEGQPTVAIDRGAWAWYAGQIIDAKRSPVQIYVASAQYNASRDIILTIEVLFHRSFSQPVRLSVAQVQDQMNYSQVFYPATGGTTRLYPYFHDHVLRQNVPDDYGVSISGSNAASQTRVSKTITFRSLDSTISTSRLIAYAHVSNGSNYGEILQAIEIPLASFVTAIGDRPEAESFELSQNFPNPFNPSTTVSFAVPRESHVSIVLTDALGRQVATIADESYLPGSHQVVFNANDLPSGTYLFTMRSGAFVQTRSMTLVK